MATVLCVASRALLTACARLGLDERALLAAAGLRREQVDDPDARIPAHAADRLWEAAFRASGDPGLAWRAVQALHGDEFRVLHHLAAASPTLGEALRGVARWLPLVDPRLELRVEEADDDVVLVLADAATHRALPRAPTEFTLGAIVAGTRRSTGHAWAPTRVELPFPRPADVDHSAFLGGRVTYGAPRAALHTDRVTWARPLPGADPSLRRLLEDYAARIDATLDRTPDDDLSPVRDAVRARLAQGGPELSDVARALAVSERSLQRTLAERGTTFREVVDAVRFEAARAWLTDPSLGLAEVGWMLGFSDQRAFTRAFVRWAGCTPGAWRGGAR